MTRRMPSYEVNSLQHPALTFSLLVACIAASIAIISSLCALCHRKPATSDSPVALTNAPETSTIQIQVEAEAEAEAPLPIEEERITELDAAIHGPIYPTSNIPAGSTSKRRLSFSLSMGLQEGLSRIKTKKEKGGRGGGEESLWKKTIILGEKCRMQNEENEGEATISRNASSNAMQSMSRNTSINARQSMSRNVSSNARQSMSRNASVASAEVSHPMFG